MKMSSIKKLQESGGTDLKYRTLVINWRWGLLSSRNQVIHPKRANDGRPKPFVVMGFDQIIIDTAEVFRDAAVRLVTMYTDDETCIPTADDFRMGAPFDFVSWGIPESADSDSLYTYFATLVLEAERKSPSKVCAGAISSIKDLSLDFDIIILTKNCIHPIAKIVEKQSGVQVEVVVVDGEITRVLDAIAEYHNFYYQRDLIPCYFFGSTPGEMCSAKDCTSPVCPVAVAPQGLLSPDNCGQKKIWKRGFPQGQVHGFVSPKKIASVAKGVHNPKDSLEKWGHIT